MQEIDAAFREARGQRAEMIAATRRANLDGVNEGQQTAAALEQELLKATAHGKLMRLTSPVDGTVQQLAVYTVGGVVTPAQPLMVIVPRDNPLEVEAFIENKDIDFVTPDQDAEVKIETFQYTKYGTIPATVTSVSHDAINDEKRGLIYSTRVRWNGPPSTWTARRSSSVPVWRCRWRSRRVSGGSSNTSSVPCCSTGMKACVNDRL